MNAVVDGKLEEVQLEWDARPALCVIASSKGYPGKYVTGTAITGIDTADEMPDVKVFHSGTKRYGAATQTNGGRVLAVTALGKDMDVARDRAYAAMAKIKFDGMHFRKDIGKIRNG